jgi:DNA-binding CsgD family transcriptional regulator
MSAARAAFDDGRTLEDIADEHGCSREYVRQLLAKQGITGRGVEYWGPRYSAHLHDEIVRRWEQGMHFDSISRSVGVSEASIRAALKSRDIKPPCTRKRTGKPALIVAMAQRGCGRVEIAKATGYTLASVTTVLHTAGIKGHPR